MNVLVRKDEEGENLTLAFDLNGTPVRALDLVRVQDNLGLFHHLWKNGSWKCCRADLKECTQPTMLHARSLEIHEYIQVVLYIK